MCQALARDYGWLPDQTLNVPIAQLWLMFRFVENRRPFDLGSIQEHYNQKRIAQGLAPIDFSKRRIER